MKEKEVTRLARRIYASWMADERWSRSVARLCAPLAFFWAEIAAKAALE